MTLFLVLPLVRFLEALEAVHALHPGRMLLLFVALAAGWWIYVPIHELLHAAGCLLMGGEVHELQIQAIYGGDLLARFIPFVVSGGQMAGRLSGFDTHGSDLIYASTVLMPFLPGLLGFTAMSWAASRGNVLLFGLLLPWVVGPLITLTGDMYELGSLALYQFWPLKRSLVGDDLPALVADHFQMAVTPELQFIALGAFLGLCIAWMLLSLSAVLSVRFYPVLEQAGYRAP